MLVTPRELFFAHLYLFSCAKPKTKNNIRKNSLKEKENGKKKTM
jgi:hypothetical protein